MGAGREYADKKRRASLHTWQSEKEKEKIKTPMSHRSKTHRGAARNKVKTLFHHKGVLCSQKGIESNITRQFCMRQKHGTQTEHQQALPRDPCGIKKSKQDIRGKQSQTQREPGLVWQSNNKERDESDQTNKAFNRALKSSSNQHSSTHKTLLKHLRQINLVFTMRRRRATKRTMREKRVLSWGASAPLFFQPDTAI